MATIRQKKLAKNIVENLQREKPLNKQDLVVSSGYAEITADRHASEVIEQKGVQEALATYGFDESAAKKVVGTILQSGELSRKPKDFLSISQARKFLSTRAPLSGHPMVTVKPYAKNAKKHPDAQLRQIALSLKEYGWRQPILVDKKDEIIVGHGRWMAYQKYPDGIKEPWIVKADDLSPEQVRGYRLMDNKTNESDWDMGLVIEELKELDSLHFDIELTGFDKDLLIEADEKDDFIPTDVPTRAKLGDLWLLGEHRVLCGDSTDKASVERLMDGKKADMVFTDPPYGVSYEEGLVDKKSRMAAHRSVSRKNTQIANDTIKSDVGLYDLLHKAFENIAENTKHGVYICYGSNRAIPFLEAFRDAGFHYASNIVWVKDRLVMGRGHYHYQYEPILYGWKEKNSGKWMGDRSQSNVWNLARPSINDLHPTMKPVELVTRALVNSSGSEDIVLDLFLGSGSTLIAAEKTGRICYGMEIDPKYVDVILKRWEDYTGNKAEKIQ